ncbi:hypothetical protein CCACVL1_16800 [Corchorus capsularis]|uniref:F-box domain-containing protein n=1 Tax=Corchorus capsularis TaxID=210143 RepID=A0A1R3HVH0_COCAP|nr:hypothetical protein CCACVL1_16800 [Corchorus capsularis]
MEYDGEEYGISKLPDEIVISILRRIPMKEAARTSVLSRRWKSLWTLCLRLELDGSKRMFYFLTKVKGYSESDREIEREGFINWVNHVLESCHAHAHALEEFKVGFGLHDKFRPEIDKWVRFGGNYLPWFARNLPLLSASNFSHLQKLVVSTGNEREWPEHPILSQLKQLELNSVIASDEDFLHCCPLIEACTSLNRLALKLYMVQLSDCKDTIREVRRPNKCVHQSLKVVEVTGFVGRTADTELCIYLIENAIMLDKIIIDPCHLVFRGTPYEDAYPEMVMRQYLPLGLVLGCGTP